MSSTRTFSLKKVKRFFRISILAALLMVFEMIPLGSLIGLENTPLPANAINDKKEKKAKKDKSDLNKDGKVNLDDLKLFSQRKMEMDWMDVNWCEYIEEHPNRARHHVQLFAFARDFFHCDLTAPVLLDPTVSDIDIPNATLGATIINDGGSPIFERGTVWNTTGHPVIENEFPEGGMDLGTYSHVRTDLNDLEIGTHVFFRGYAKNSMGTGYSPMSSFAIPDPLAVKNSNTCPTRLALGPNGDLYVTDPKAKSVFIYDTDLKLKGELKNLTSPLSVAVDSTGHIYVGNAVVGNVEKYNPKGRLILTIGQGQINTPSDLTLDWEGNIYIADKESNLVWIFKPDGTLFKALRSDGLRGPIAVEVSYYENETGQVIGELFIADKGNYMVRVFDLQGNQIRSFGGFPTKKGWFKPTWNWYGKFIGLQSLAVDSNGNLHALDLYINKVQILNPVTGAYIADYGEYGTGPGQFKLPMDIIINNYGQVIVANFDNQRVEVIYTVP